MEKEFENERIKNEYEDSKGIQKRYGSVFAEGLTKMMGAVDSAENAYDIKCLPQYRMHMLHGNLNGVYSLSPDNKKTKWRVPATCLDNQGVERKPSKDLEEIDLLKSTQKFRFKKIGDYHD